MRILKPLSWIVINEAQRSILFRQNYLKTLIGQQRFHSSSDAKKSVTNKIETNQKTSTDINIEQDDELSEDSIYSREFETYTTESFEELYKDDQTNLVKDKIATVLKEYEFHKYNSLGRVPSKLSIKDMKLFLDEGPSPGLREKLIHFLYKREMAKRTTFNRKQRDREEKKGIRQEKFKGFIEKYGDVRTGLLSEDGSIIYGLWHNTLLPRIPENKLKSGSSMDNLIDSAQFGKKIIFDFDFDKHMSPWISRNSAEQVLESYGINRFKYKQPFDLWFCNFRSNENGPGYFEKIFPHLYDRSMITVKQDCFTNHFDKSRLVYLSPNAFTKLDEDIRTNDDIYILGVYNDKGGSKPLTLRKAEALGIRSRSLPLDNYLAWQGGSKSLCVNHVLGILNEVMENGGDWRAALMKHVPERKLKTTEELIEIEKLRSAKSVRANARKFNLQKDLFND